MEQVKSKRGGARPNTGGKRPGAGRPRVKGTLQDCIDDLIIPSVVTAWQNEKNQENPFDGPWVIHLSKKNIRWLYGDEALRLFCSYFTEVKRGGVSKDGVPYFTRWIVNWGQYAVVKRLLEGAGHSMKDIQAIQVKFPPDAYVKRLEEAKKRAIAGRLKKLGDNAERQLAELVELK